MKYLVETTGQFMLVDFDTGCNVESYRPCVVKQSAFIAQRHLLGQLRTLGTVSDEATDEDFLAYWKECEGDAAFAVSSFLSKYEAPEISMKAPPAIEPAPKGKRGKRK